MTHIPRREYRPTDRPCPVTELPFVKDIRLAPRRAQRCFWAVDRTDDYAMACDKGREFAAHYLQFLKDGNPSYGLLGWIATHMAEADALNDQRRDATHGYAAGFFTLIQSVLHLAMRDADPFALAQREIDDAASGGL